MKVLFINDSTSQRNWGDRAAATSLKTMMRERGGEIACAITERDLTVSSFCKGSSEVETSTEDKTKEYLRPLIPPAVLELRRMLVPDEHRSRRSRYIPARWEEFESHARAVLRSDSPWPELLDVFETIDVAVIHGDGCMVGNGVVPRTELFFAYLLKRHFDKPVIIVNHTADFDHPDLRRVAEAVYPLFDDVVFRDPLSRDKCERMCSGRFVPDSAFLFRPAAKNIWLPVVSRETYFDVWPEQAAFDPARPYLCVGGSSALGTLERPETISAQYGELIDQIQTVYPGQVVLTASDFVDQVVFRYLAAQKGLPLISVRTPIQQAVDILGNADAYIGGRWHPGIFALSGGAPLVILSGKTFKMQALAEMAGLPSAGFDALRPAKDKEALARLVSSLLDQGPVLRERIKAWAEECAEQCWGNVAYLEHWAG